MMPPNNLILRTDLRPGDMSWIVSSHINYYHEHYDYGLKFEYYCGKAMQETYELYQPEKSRFWMLSREEEKVGSLILLDRGELAQLRFFYLDESVRGQGMGKGLLTAFMEYLSDKRYAGAYLWTTDEQLTALRLYRRFGFRLTEERSSTTFGRKINEQRYDFRF